jgi:hypothetical protein
VPVKVNLEGGEIGAGDPLTISNQAGVLRKANDNNPIVAIALSSINQEDFERVENPTVLAFIQINGYGGSIQNNFDNSGESENEGIENNFDEQESKEKVKELENEIEKIDDSNS